MTAVAADEKLDRPRKLTNVIGVRLEPALYDRIEAAAQGEGRTLSGWMRQMAIERLAAERRP